MGSCEKPPATKTKKRTSWEIQVMFLCVLCSQMRSEGFPFMNGDLGVGQCLLTVGVERKREEKKGRERKEKRTRKENKGKDANLLKTKPNTKHMFGIIYYLKFVCGVIDHYPALSKCLTPGLSNCIARKLHATKPFLLNNKMASTLSTKGLLPANNLQQYRRLCR